ncbi:MAG: DNA repair protein RadA [Candidatus Lambdaproteobacteria bacterium RIFOXYD1_FULL_56_27]|uniref:DNA repair protein RadA n=1 Tax=Candidatus Lambdaproteobacteria bacterium RIFOXYD2_FULL_56_26 TaxID=1817773 RepID=A0A1F6H0P6_9PROT|nr:MAG: DNA repair protein RadA [Candidatus Lambdaproteobacteria bacterium RIFOXYC1_FULL_56_13]OGH03860.1 MAG: DNA repair protein RadA [Candidatus Lambdaproteobacteria bacterium RIFOXYD2_FULL_56_26]OGH08988.1 MAG: DNA repair protein RadA [Candidatus Lambdaproteobacteria bacterium RIFOXYD1_FULL_56_27]
MAKNKTQFFCQNCGAKQLQWSGRCSACGEWNTLVEEGASPSHAKTLGWVPPKSEVHKLTDVDDLSLRERWVTGVKEFDRVVGGGILPGSFGLLGGTPGVGKSTLILQLMSRIVGLGKKTLYISGEESLGQIKDRAGRLLVDQEKLLVLVESNLEGIVEKLEQENPDFVVIDSIQTLYSIQFSASPGSVTQVREGAAILMRYAKAKGAALLLIGHVTKDGAIAGPRTLEHMVDYVLYLEGEKNEPARILRAVKNRFGTISELGLFKMTPKGLAEMVNPNRVFLEQFHWTHPGMSVFALAEGTRTLFVEVQVLVGDTEQKAPARMAVGTEKTRLQVMVAVLEKSLGLDFSRNDIYLNLAGGFKTSEPALDMAVCAALLSSHLRTLLPEKSLFVGEVALTGEFRNVPGLEERVQEAQRCGFSKFYLPQKAKAKMAERGVGIELVGINDVNQLLEELR